MKFNIKPFEFQANAVEKIFQIWDRGAQSAALVSPPSSGKTVMAAMIIDRIIRTWENGNLRIFFFVHLEDLQKSTRKALSPYFPNAKDINAIGGRYGSSKLRPEAKIHVCMVQTFISRMKKQNWASYLSQDVTSLCIFDECHLGHHDKVIRFLREERPDIKILGLTGTFKKMANANLQLAYIYDERVKTVSEIELIRIKRVVPPYMLLPEEQAENLELENVPTIQSGDNKGEFQAVALSSHMRKKKYVYTGLEKIYKEYCKGLKMLVFCVDVMHCISIAKHLNNTGIRAKFFASVKTKPKLAKDANEHKQELYRRQMEVYTAQQEALRLFQTGNKETILSQWGRDFEVLVNVGVFTTGFDDDDIMVVADCAPTNSENLYLQKYGRGKRIKDGKSFFYYIDMAENQQRFGHPCAERDYPLEFDEPEKKERKGEAPTKICPECGQSIPAHELVCMAPRFEGLTPVGTCGYKFPKKRLERDTKFKLVKFDQMLEMSAPQVNSEFKKSKRTTVSDIYEYYKERWKTDRPLDPKWLFFTIYELFGIGGLVEFAHKTNRDKAVFMQNVQQFTNGEIAAWDMYQEIIKK